MEGTLPTKASAFVIVKRRDGAFLCTLEGDGEIGVPGGKWEPERDGFSWDRLAAREYEEEVGAPLPTPVSAGYLEWGSDAYQVRFKVLTVSDGVADGIPTGPSSDPDGAVHEVFWVRPEVLRKRRVRAHVKTALDVLNSFKIIAREAERRPRTASYSGYTLEDALGW